MDFRIPDFIVWHIRVREPVSPFSGPRVERTFTFAGPDTEGALTCFRQAHRHGFEVQVRKVLRVKERVG